MYTSNLKVKLRICILYKLPFAYTMYTLTYTA